MKRIICASLLAMVVGVSPAAAVPHKGDEQCSKACVERVKAKVRADIARKHRRALVREMRGYKADPMPSCTWLGESSWDPATGKSFFGRPFAPGRYRVVNPDSGTGGKFQFMPTTWRGLGGARFAWLPQDALPVYQERLARRLHPIEQHWVNC